MLAAFFLLGVVGCKSGPQDKPEVSYKTSAKENFLKGKQELDDENFLEAEEFFRFVKSKFPYSSYATDADLFLCDCEFGRERYLEAADSYQNFIKMHPKHPKVPYAAFRVGLCYYNRIPSDWWLFPPAYELDQIETEKTIRELKNYLRLYPEAENAKEAGELQKTCLERMAKRTYYVMSFYRKRDHHRGVLWRASELLQNYAGFGFDEEVLFRKAEAQAGLKDWSGARATLAELFKQFPEGKYAGKGRDLEKALPEQSAAAPAVPAAPPPSAAEKK